LGGLRVLITNYVMASRTGTELYVRDLAIALLRRGHTPVVYTTEVGEAGLRLREATVPVIADLDKISSPPDIIHGQHHVETMTALAHFHNAPAVFFCHGWRPWEERPPRHPRIYRYVAVDDTCRDRLLFEGGISEERTRVLLNALDLERFRPRPPLPEKPRRALVFSNSVLDYVPVVREACARTGLSLDVAGEYNGNLLGEPEKVLAEYDLVFAKARCALEALAVGASVVLCDAAGAGPLVTSLEVARLRRLNFGIRALGEELRPDVLVREIERYDAADAAEVSRRIRAEADQEQSFDETLALYEEAIAEHARAPRDAAGEGRAVAEYLRWVMSDIRRERHVMSNSPLGRLRERLLGVPLLGALAQTAAKKLREEGKRQEAKGKIQK